MQADFTYGSVEAPFGIGDGGQAIALSIFADRPLVREALREDAAAAGFHLLTVGDLGALTGGEAPVLGDVVLLDCPYVCEDTLIALLRLDERVARSGAQLIASTSPDGIDDIFGCLEVSRPQILVDPSRAERVVAMGRALARSPLARVRELSEEDRLSLVRLAEQVECIARRLDTAIEPRRAGLAFNLNAPSIGYRAPGDDYAVDRRRPKARAPALPEAAAIRRVIKARQVRARYFDAELFADPAWDMLLDLAAARAEGARVCVTSLCIAAAVPPTTALRWIGQMVEAGLLVRMQDLDDRRRAFIALSDGAAEDMARYFAEVGVGAGELVAA